MPKKPRKLSLEIVEQLGSDDTTVLQVNELTEDEAATLRKEARKLVDELKARIKYCQDQQLLPAYVVVYRNLPAYKGSDAYVQLKNRGNGKGGTIHHTGILADATRFTLKEASEYAEIRVKLDKAHSSVRIIPLEDEIDDHNDA